jgi:alkanesulfonate monooxygenase
LELGLHVANYTWSGGDERIAPTLAGLARRAEDAGVARLTVMDHIWQIRGVGPPEHAMLEAYTTLGFIAASTQRIRLHTLVTGVVYRHPGMLAKQVTTLDVLSGGRAGLGIGAAWNEEESRGLGIPFAPIAERFERLEETLKICLQMWSGEEEPFEGEHYTLGRTLNSPQALTRPRPPIMIGGGGERKTLRLVARYADACNIIAREGFAAKLDVLRGHCEAEGRDYDSIEKTGLLIAPVTHEGGPGPVLEALRELHDASFTAAYVMIPDAEPLPALEMLAEHVIPEISDW